MPYVSVKISDGLGNRLFQVAAMLGYAERHGHTPVFIRSWILPNPSHPGPLTITDLFPTIPVLESAEGDWTELHMPGDAVFTYIPLPANPGNVKLNGYFQSALYFPSRRITPALPVSEFPTPPGAFFLHVRRGDYVSSPYTAHHRVELQDYYRRALTLVDASHPIVVCSDDRDWCIATLPSALSDVVAPHRWIFVPSNVSDAETWAIMAACDGGICANSTFSWWGAYFSRRTEVYMPDIWGYPPLPPAHDVYPDWAVQLPVSKK